MTFLALMDASLLATAQSTVQHLPVDLASIVSWAMKGVLTLIGGVLLWALKGAVQSFLQSFNDFKNEMTTRLDTIDSSISMVQSDVHTTKQELFGVSGSNGIRGELREIKADARKTKDLAQTHEVLLGRLADKAGIHFEGHS